MASAVSQPRPAAVAAVLAQAATWTSARRKADGHPFYIVRGNRPGAAYYADATACTCPDARERGRRCKHSIAVGQFEDKKAKRLGLATDAQVDAIVGETALRLRDDFGPCIDRGGCDKATGKSKRCDSHFKALIEKLGI